MDNKAFRRYSPERVAAKCFAQCFVLLFEKHEKNIIRLAENKIFLIDKKKAGEKKSRPKTQGKNKEKFGKLNRNDLICKSIS